MTSDNTNPFIDRDDVIKQITSEFSVRDSTYPGRKSEMKAQLAPLENRLTTLQASGHPMDCAEQILLEAHWLINYRDDWTAAQERLGALAKSLDNVDQPESPMRRSQRASFHNTIQLSK
jgi:hypothetical protein